MLYYIVKNVIQSRNMFFVFSHNKIIKYVCFYAPDKAAFWESRFFSKLKSRKGIASNF